ncbi:hypothetical protein DGo_CA2773 [Deinococcus gobiensis I-0]|uniref:Cas12f1-like TNB domain-containing protein n=2 Tax=Deinococcus TaxID=1298 RepID=H8GUL7_DEIGI|nr:hypothetical protein DGo_CA2773 [Deinococcus gobiensis I-0]
MGKLIPSPTPLRPTTDQAAHLTRLITEARSLHIWLRRYLRLRGAGIPLGLPEALRRVDAGAALPDVDDFQKMQMPNDALAELRGLTFAERPARWQHVPQSVALGIVAANTNRLKRHRSGESARYMFPLLRLDDVPLDAAVQPLDLHHVLLAGLPTPIVTDLWALPADLSTALMIEADDRARAVHARTAAVHERVRSGCPDALLELYPHAELLALQRDRTPTLTRDRERPHRADHVWLTEVTESSGEVVPALRWSIRVPDRHLPAASIDDTIGADVGLRNLVTLADRSQVWHVPRRAQVRSLPSTDPRSAAALLVDAQARRMILEAARPELEAALVRTLSYRRANIEALSYQGMRDHGRVPWAPGAMHLSGAAVWGTWVELLAPVTGTQVRRVNPAGTSTTCPHCGLLCVRPAPYDIVECPTHGAMDADEAGARMIRLV